MNKFTGLAVSGFTALANLNVAVASDSDIGEFTTRIPETQLFTEDGGILRCDLFFTLPGAEPVVAPKGSGVGQSVPSVVWQYSGLLPVSDYMKTVAIHSVASEGQARPWQQVQKFFYSGLLAEGATEADAKVAFAGAYAFAPRWTLVEFVEVEETNPTYPNTILYDVNYVEPAIKGLSVEDYQTLAQQILDQPDAVSLADIRSVIDAADGGGTGIASTAAVDTGKQETTSGLVSPVGVAAVTSLFVPDSVSDVEPIFSDSATDGRVGKDAVTETALVVAALDNPSSFGIKTSGNGSLVLGDQRLVSKSSDGSLPDTAKNAPLPELPETIIIEAPQTLVLEPAAEAVPELIPEAIPEEVTETAGSVMAEVVGAPDAGDTQETQTSVEELNPEVTVTDEWVTLPDGTIVLRDIEKLASE